MEEKKDQAVTQTVNFFKELTGYYWHENDLSNITVALCNSCAWFKEKFLHFFFPNLEVADVANIRREVWDDNGSGSRVDIFIRMNNGEKYIVEVKIGDKNHHFGQYDSAFDVDKKHFGYITNYFCHDGVYGGYISKTWEEFFRYVSSTNDSDNGLISGYLKYLEYVCNITTYNNTMNFSNLSTIPQFFKVMEELVTEESLNLHIGPYCGSYNEKLSDIGWSKRYFEISNTDNSVWELTGAFLLTYDNSATISIGLVPSERTNFEDIENNEAKNRFDFIKPPYVDRDWWGYLWFDLTDDRIKELDTLSSPEEQKTLLRSFLQEVMSVIRKNC